MELQQSNSSPTLGEEPTILKDYFSHIDYKIKIVCGIARTKSKCKLAIQTDINGEAQFFQFEDLPDEFRKAFHDYGTRLIAERNIQFASLYNE